MKFNILSNEEKAKFVNQKGIVFLADGDSDVMYLEESDGELRIWSSINDEWWDVTKFEYLGNGGFDVVANDIFFTVEALVRFTEF